MMEFMDKKDILDLKQQGVSNRETARRLGVDRKTVAKYWDEYKQGMAQLKEKDADTRAIQEELYKKPEYQSSGRGARKYTEEMDKCLREILAEERRKDTILGPGHKQKLTNKLLNPSRSQAIKGLRIIMLLFRFPVDRFSTITTGPFFA